MLKFNMVPEDEATRLVAEELCYADPRSSVYWEGMADALRGRMGGVPLPRPYRPGMVEFDARQAGIEHGLAIYRRLTSGVVPHRDDRLSKAPQKQKGEK
jgi:hypothetical protein